MELTLKLHKQQSKCFRSRATEILYGGAAGGGKSHLMRVAAIAWCYAIPGLQVYIFRRTSPDLLANHMDGPSGFPALLCEWIDAGVVKINYGVSEIHFMNGPSGDSKGASRIFLRHCQYEKNRFNYQGAEIHVLMIDELTHFTETIYRYLRGRVRLGGLRVPQEYKNFFPRIVGASNPGGVGHNWVKRTFIDYARPMEIIKTIPKEGGMLRQYIPAKISDNPTLLANDPEYEQRLEALGDPALVAAMKSGDWNIVAGGMFDDVWKPDIHILSPFTIPGSWIVDRSFDWGSSRPYSVGWWAESSGESVIMSDGTKRTFPPKTIFRIAENYGWNGNPNEGVKLTAREISQRITAKETELLNSPLLSAHREIRPGPADSAIFDTQNGNCIAQDMLDSGITWLHADKRPGSRINGWEVLRSRLKAALIQPIEEPALFVFDTCLHFIRTVPVLPRAENNPDDVDTKAEDHVGDETRYRLTLSDSARGLFRNTDLS